MLQYDSSALSAGIQTAVQCRVGASVPLRLRRQAFRGPAACSMCDLQWMQEWPLAWTRAVGVCDISNPRMRVAERAVLCLCLHSIASNGLHMLVEQQLAFQWMLSAAVMCMHACMHVAPGDCLPSLAIYSWLSIYHSLTCWQTLLVACTYADPADGTYICSRLAAGFRGG